MENISEDYKLTNMKELSIEEKAKRYDEALERAKERYENMPLYDLEYVFPELCESDDERIRKEIIEVIESLSLEKEYEYIAWLEKQGEITKEWSEMKINRIQTELQEMVDLKLKTEQGKKNPADVSKQEPIDTTDLTDFEKCFKGMCCDKNQKFVKECCVSLLELARKQIQGEPKQEWSEEDRETIDYLIDYLESELDSSYTKEDKEEFTKEIELLKSLRPKNTWKPSNEQMMAIDTAINVLGKGTLNGKQLMGLQEQLKKLREE